MIYSTLVVPSKDALKNAFEDLLDKVRGSLEDYGRKNPDEMRANSGKALEKIVLKHMDVLSKNTPFQGTLKETSVQAFPDIVAKGLYGVEVKSSFGDKWQTIGNSVNESTRVAGLSTIYIMFGQLHDTISFRTRRYEDCLSDIIVTHYPRYWIDMNLKEGQSIFDKMKTPYDDLRSKDDPFTPIRDYYRSIKKPGETLWWIDERNVNERALSPLVRSFVDLPAEEKKSIWAQAMILFPNILARGNNNKYDEVAGWLVVRYGIVCASLRDLFSAGGRCDVFIKGERRKLPAVFGRLMEGFESISHELEVLSEAELSEHWDALHDKRCAKCSSTDRRCEDCRSQDGRCKFCAKKNNRCGACRRQDWFYFANKEIKTWQFKFDLDVQDLIGAF